MKYLALLGRQPEISVAELEAIGAKVGKIQPSGTNFLAKLEIDHEIDLSRLGGTPKIALLLAKSPLETLLSAPEGKITFAISEFSAPNPAKTAFSEAMRLKRKLLQQGRSVRIIGSKTGVLTTATSLHNGLSGKNPRKIELVHFENSWYRITGVQDIDAYAKRDQNRPARDPKIGMLPPKLAQVLLNLATGLPPHSRILDPFCGTGVVLQEALLLGFRAYGTDIDPKMVKYSLKNLQWLETSNQHFSEHPDLQRESAHRLRNEPERSEGLAQTSGHLRGTPKNSLPEFSQFEISEGDATNFQWSKPLDAVVTEGYLGKPFSKIPSGPAVREEILTCKALITHFLKNLAPQIAPNTPVITCAPAWLRPSGEYLRLNILDEIQELGYNVNNKTRAGLIYHREDQIVARDIIILRKK